MTSSSREVSLLEGEPLQLLRFARGRREWLYTTGDRDYIYRAATYAAVRGGIRCASYTEGAELRKLTRQVTIPAALEVANEWWPYPPSEPVSLTILATHAGEDDALIDWTGRIVSARRLDDGSVELQGEPTQTAARRRCQNRCWQRTCPLVVYSQGLGMCNADPLAFRRGGVVTSVSGLTVQSAVAATFQSTRLIGGYVEFTRAADIVERRGITLHSGDTFVLEYGVMGLAVGMEIMLYPGCNQSIDDCANYFHNTLNFGGVPWMPLRSPFDGNPVW